MGDAVNVWRDDAVHMEITKEEALKNAPLADSDYFKVPKVLKRSKNMATAIIELHGIRKAYDLGKMKLEVLKGSIW